MSVCVRQPEWMCVCGGCGCGGWVTEYVIARMRRRRLGIMRVRFETFALLPRTPRLGDVASGREINRMC